MRHPQPLRANEARALTALFRRGAMTRAELARTLGLTRSTTGNLVQNLSDAGLVREGSEPGEDAASRVGRPGIAVEIAGDGAFFLGADIGVDRVEALAIDLAGNVRATATRDARGGARDPGASVARAVALVREVIGALPPAATLRGLSVAVPGFPADDGRSYHAILLGWHGVALSDLLDEAIGGELPVLLENDANAFAVAETYPWTGEDHDPEDVLVVLIENGVGAGIISGGRLHRGRRRGAGEIGHVLVGPEGYAFDGVRPGRLETYVGKNALLARDAYRRGIARSLDDFLEALAGGESSARSTAEEWGLWLARGLVAASCLLQPQRIILGGSVGAVFPHVAETVETAIRAALVEGYPVPIVQSAAARTGRPALGAAFLLHQAMLSNDLAGAPSSGAPAFEQE